MSDDRLRALLTPVPQVQVVPRRPATGFAYWRTAWSARHTFAALAATPVLFAVNSGLAGEDATGDPLSVTLVVAVSAIAAVVLATFVPPRGASAAGTVTGCAGASLLALFAAGALLQDLPTSVVSGFLSLGVVIATLAQRLLTATACSS